MKSQIQERVKQEIDKQQRDYYLQQQMRTIQDELGDGADADIEKMREEAKKKNWPKEVGETFEKELQKVERLNPAVAEYSVQMTYLQLLLELPWNDTTKDNLDLKCAREQLDRDHFGLDEVKERIPGASGRHQAQRATSSRRSSASTAPSGWWARPRWASRWRRRWAASSAAFRWAACTTSPRFADTAAPTSAPCRAGSSDHQAVRFVEPRDYPRRGWTR